MQQAESDRRRWFQFSLRTLLLFVLFFSVGMSWLGVRIRRAERQSLAIATINTLGGDVTYDYVHESYERQILPTRPWPDWVYQCAGVDLLHSVVEADLDRYAMDMSDGIIDRPIADSDLDVLAAFPQLREVHLKFRPITDSGLQKLAACSELERICVYGTDVTDKGVQSLADLAKLQELDVGDTEVTIPGLKALHKKMPSLTSVAIGETQLAAAGGWNGAHMALPGIALVKVHYSPEGGVSFEVR